MSVVGYQENYWLIRHLGKLIDVYYRHTRKMQCKTNFLNVANKSIVDMAFDSYNVSLCQYAQSESYQPYEIFCSEQGIDYMSTYSKFDTELICQIGRLIHVINLTKLYDDSETSINLSSQFCLNSTISTIIELLDNTALIIYWMTAIWRTHSNFYQFYKMWLNKLSGIETTLVESILPCLKAELKKYTIHSDSAKTDKFNATITRIHINANFRLVNFSFHSVIYNFY